MQGTNIEMTNEDKIASLESYVKSLQKKILILFRFAEWTPNSGWTKFMDDNWYHDDDKECTNPKTTQELF